MLKAIMTWFAHTRVAPKQHTLIFLRVEVSIYRDTLKFQVERLLHLQLLTGERQTPGHSFLKTPPCLAGSPLLQRDRDSNSEQCYLLLVFKTSSSSNHGLPLYEQHFILHQTCSPITDLCVAWGQLHQRSVCPALRTRTSPPKGPDLQSGC